MRIRRDARERYRIEDAFFSRSGHLVMEGIRGAHQVAALINASRAGQDQLSPAELNAARIVHEVFHQSISEFVHNHDPGFFRRALSTAEESVGRQPVDETLVSFVDRFPPDEVLKEAVPASSYLESTTDEGPNREVTLEEILISWLSNENPAYQPFHELIHDDDIRETTAYQDVVTRFSDAAESGPASGFRVGNLIDVLREPARRSPTSLKDQLAFMTGGGWELELPPELRRQAEIGQDLITEEQRAMAARFFAPGPPPPPPVPDFHDEPEHEQFSQDVDWMPRVIMVAKNAIVWLDQLSRKHERDIRRLDEIPEEEIEQLGRWGVTALWLIGVWERSSASKELKIRTGNPEAESSAYSLHDYVVAEKLGGTSALTGLRVICQRHGIRLAADMVPNHTGIHSKWVTEHPDWFIQLAYAPYPAYSYTSASLSDDPNILIQVEDGYYDRSDAAVTFRRLDLQSGDERFIYHGNDGTSMPWNDTAQLDFTKAEVREAVIQTILHVARQFPVIRFDAAMVLTRKHFRRLWYPPPGSGGGVPSRAEHGLTREQFDERMPAEFWREVVDRVAEEVPDTLLLAEAFWLLEGYFVRTLGMHRVYNSAFMHMLKDEDNAKYRSVMKNTLSFEPEVLKRYVNFMSNPDEETAIQQFGDGDKFFGVFTLMVTMPGLPMIAHGQIEGLREKYGMEYGRAYHDEEVREDLVNRFEREITPLIRRRHLFAEVANFYLFDFETGHGVDENVFAFTNRSGHERALIIYNNRFGSTTGRLRHSTVLEGRTSGVSLAHALGIQPTAGELVTYRDLRTGLEFVARAHSFNHEGLALNLHGYECHAFAGFQVVADDDDGTLASLADRLSGRGVADLEEARLDILYKPLERMVTGIVRSSLDGATGAGKFDADQAGEVCQVLGVEADELKSDMENFARAIESILDLDDLASRFSWPRGKRYKEAVEFIGDSVANGSPVLAVLVGVECVRMLVHLGAKGVGRMTRSVLVSGGLAEHGMAAGIEALARALAGTPAETDASALESILDEERFGAAFSLNEFAGTTYYNKEQFELGLDAALALAALELARTATGRSKRETAESIAKAYGAYRKLMERHEESEFDWARVREVRSERREARSEKREA